MLSDTGVPDVVARLAVTVLPAPVVVDIEDTISVDLEVWVPTVFVVIPVTTDDTGPELVKLDEPPLPPSLS